MARTITPIGNGVYFIFSEPGDATGYEYLIYRDGPDEFCFASRSNAFNYPQRINYWEVKDTPLTEAIDKLTKKYDCNPHTVIECFAAIKQLWEGSYPSTEER